MQTSDLNVNNTESDHATAIFHQFQDAIFSREHASVKTSTKIIFDLLRWQETATLSLPKNAAIAPFISTTFRGHFCLGASAIARNRSRVIFCRACVDIFRRWIPILVPRSRRLSRVALGKRMVNPFKEIWLISQFPAKRTGVASSAKIVFACPGLARLLGYGHGVIKNKTLWLTAWLY